MTTFFDEIRKKETDKDLLEWYSLLEKAFNKHRQIKENRPEIIEGSNIFWSISNNKIEHAHLWASLNAEAMLRPLFTLYERFPGLFELIVEIGRGKREENNGIGGTLPNIDKHNLN